MQTCVGDVIHLRSKRNYHREWSRARENVGVWAEVCPGGDNSLKCVLVGFVDLFRKFSKKTKNYKPLSVNFLP